MRHYTITLARGFAIFKCPLCGHSVTTQDFGSQNGSRRTQAARVMNEHADAAHGYHTYMPPSDAQMRPANHARTHVKSNPGK